MTSFMYVISANIVILTACGFLSRGSLYRFLLVSAIRPMDFNVACTAFKIKSRPNACCILEQFNNICELPISEIFLGTHFWDNMGKKIISIRRYCLGYRNLGKGIPYIHYLNQQKSELESDQCVVMYRPMWL